MNFERRDRYSEPKNDRNVRKSFGKNRNTVDIDLSRVKTVNAEALARSVQHNKIVDKIAYSTDSGRYIELSGNMSTYFTLMPTKPLVDCKYIRLLETVMIKNDATNRKNITYVRGCAMNKKHGEIPDLCSISNEKIKLGLCFGNKFQTSSLEFIIVSKGHIEIDGNRKEFKFVFINKKNNFSKEEFRDNPDIIKNKALFELYNGIRSGVIKVHSIPKPGNILFHTAFSREVNVEVETIRGDILKGVVRGYEFTPGGHPSLNLFYKDESVDNTGNVENKEEKLRVLPMYTIGTMIIYDYKTNDTLGNRAIDLTLAGHIVIPHRGNNTIYDYCKSSKTGKEQEIKLDGTVIPIDQSDHHDIEIKRMIKN